MVMILYLLKVNGGLTRKSLKRKYKLMPRNIFLLILITLVTACTSKKQTSSKSIITVSILPQKYFVEAIAGDRFNINVMVPPGAAPENYEPTAMQMRNLSESKIYFRIGYIPFEENWMKNFTGINPAMRIYDTSQGIDLIASGEENEKGVDPHIWSSARNAQIIARNIYDALTREDPENTGIYSERLASFLKETKFLDSTLREGSATIKNRTFLIFHPALAYLARDYGLEQLSVEYEGKNPPPGYMKKIINTCREKNIKGILVQKQFNAGQAEIIAREISGKVIIIDPLDENWDDQMKHIVKSITEASGNSSN
jgi:zinc transport system substrate-binding protein